MPTVTNRHSYSNTRKSLIKNSHKVRLRRDNTRKIEEGIESLVEPETHHDEIDAFLNTPEFTLVPAAVLVWDDGLDYNLDGTSYQDDCPGDYPHSYHRSLKDAELEAAWLEYTGCDPRNIRIAQHFWVPDWDARRIPR